MPHDDQDKEFDPKFLFGISREQKKEIEQKVRRKQKKLAKNYRPITH
jgi:hypothetical protein